MSRRSGQICSDTPGTSITRPATLYLPLTPLPCPFILYPSTTTTQISIPFLNFIVSGYHLVVSFLVGTSSPADPSLSSPESLVGYCDGVHTEQTKYSRKI